MGLVSRKTLQLSGALLRPWLYDDVNSLIKAANDKDVSATLRDSFPYPYKREHAIDWITFALEVIPTCHFAIVVDGAACGGIGLTLQRDVFRYSAEIGYWLAKEHWGKGIMSQAVVAVSDYAFYELGMTRVFAGTFDHNKASGRILEKAGFKLEGRLSKAIFKYDRFYDQLMYGKVALR